MAIISFPNSVSPSISKNATFHVIGPAVGTMAITSLRRLIGRLAYTLRKRSFPCI